VPAAEGAAPVAVGAEPAPDGTAPPHDTSAELRWVRANACEDQSPMSLTASDGTGLALRSIKARAAVEGPLALTELHLSFDNPEDRQLEGRFAITLPPGAAVSRFAMKIDGRWQEGEVVERQAARRAYEDFLHRRQDPALLENDAGNVFRARVFPIPPRGQKDIVIAYSQSLSAEDEPWRLPLCGLPTLGELDVDVAIVRGAQFTQGADAVNVQHLSVREQNYTPRQDLEAWAGKARSQGVRHGDLAVARIKPVLADADAPLTSLTILFDTSASRALDFRGQVQRLGKLVAGLAAASPTLTIKVAAFDQNLVSVYDGAASGFGETQLATLRERGAMGASDLHAALSHLSTRGLVSPRVLLIGDGVATAGDIDAAGLSSALTDLQAKGVTRFDALVDGGIQDAELLEQLTRDSLDTDGVVLDARLELASVVERLNQATRSGIDVRVEGAEWVWPRTLDGVQPGDEVLVYAQLPPEADFVVSLGGAALAEASPTLSVAPGPLLGRAHAEARIAALQMELSALASTDETQSKRKSIKERIIQLSTQHRVLSDHTALLVLETEADYARFNIPRNALTDILTVGPSGVDLMHRAGTQQVDEPKPTEISRKDDRVDFDKVDKKESAKKKTKMAAAPEAKSALGGSPDDGDFGRFDDAESEEEADGPVERNGGAEPPGEAADPTAPPPPPTPEPEPAPSHDESPVDAVVQGGSSGRTGEPTAQRRRSRVRDSRPAAHPASRRRRPSHGSAPISPKEKPRKANGWSGKFGDVMSDLARGDLKAGRDAAAKWRKDQPGDVLALVALGEAFEAAGNPTDAARAYGSLIDLFPSRADLRRMAGERLERLGADGLDLAVDTYDKALESRPDQPSGARLLAYALAKKGDYKAAFETLEAAFDRRYPSGRFAEIHRILREDLGLIGKAWIASDGSVDKTVSAALTRRGATLPSGPSTRFVLTWETDANDVDLHVYNGKGEHAYYSRKSMASGGNLYADVTTGYGPECFTIDGKPTAGPYQLQAHYYRRGPMGYGMGKLQVLTHDGKGHLEIEDHPFVIMVDDAYVDLATVGR